MKKTLLSIATAGAVALVALAPTQASAGKVHVDVGIYGGGFGVGFFPGPGYYGGPYYGGPYYGPAEYSPYPVKHCKVFKKKKWTPYGWKWKKVKKCWYN